MDRGLEVKTSGYLQSWAQAKHSELSFGRVAARSWHENTNVYGAAPKVRADVFVFAVQTCKDPDAYDALDISQWEFYVVHAKHVRECGTKSVSIAWVMRYAQPVPFAQLPDVVESVAASTVPES